MAVLRSLTINTTQGLTYVNYPPQFLGLDIVCVKREGLQYDKVAAADINNGTVRQWALSGGISVRIKFPSSIPFNSGEKVFVIYKPIE
jgi:hypothetical protein